MQKYLSPGVCYIWKQENITYPFLCTFNYLLDIQEKVVDTLEHQPDAEGDEDEEDYEEDDKDDKDDDPEMTAMLMVW